MHIQLEKSLHTTLYAADGSVLIEEAHEPNSIVTAFSDILYTHFAFTDDNGRAEDVTGATHDINENNNNFESTQSDNVDGPGVVFGSDNTAVDYEDTDLGSRFTTDVSYNSGTASINETNSQTDLQVQRAVTNTGTNAITAREAGHVAVGVDTNNNSRNFLVARDVLDTAREIDPNQSFQGTYTYTFKL